jgi:hypothetical protein
MWWAATQAAVVLWFLPKTQTVSAPTPALGPFIFSLETEVEENPIDETTTVAEMLRRPAVSAEPQVVGPAPFRVAMAPERIWQPDSPRGNGRNDQTDHRYEGVSEAGMKEAASVGGLFQNLISPMVMMLPAVMMASAPSVMMTSTAVMAPAVHLDH